MASDDGCADCERTDIPVFFCSGCSGISFCDSCWPKQAAHKTKAVNLRGQPHMKEDKAKILMIRSVLEPSMDPVEIRELHKKDQDSRWLGVVKHGDTNESRFHNFGRYEQLMIDSRPLGGATRYPKLVSFIGDTYAGKSTVVKALVSHGGLLSKDTDQGALHTPVPGSRANEGTATSEGVHLYPDPEHLESVMPILYADCEGLNAGEKIPFAGEESELPQKATRETGGHKSVLKKKLPGSSLPLLWTKGNDPVRGTREFAVSNLYPKFLYTFSDAIVFVQRNPNQLHITYKSLIDWARHSVEKSLNQPILPSAIVVVNAVEVAGEAERWTTDDATESFFRDVEGMTVSDPDLKELARDFTENDSRSLSARELLECYYRSVRVIRIPAKSTDTYNLINTQILRLREEIAQLCTATHYEKVIKRRMVNVDELEEYLQAGFIHFAKNISAPFDFRTVSARNKLIAHNFADHILTLARTIYESTRRERLKPSMLFAGMSSLVASCIFLDCVRNNLQGPVLDYFPKDYAPFCKTALQMFCNDVLPCEYTSKKIPQCCNVSSAHDKGHQNLNGNREIGEFVSSLNASSYQEEWIHNIEEKLRSLSNAFTMELRKNYPQSGNMSPHPSIDHDISTPTDMKVASKLHDEMLAEFFSRMKSTKDFFSCVSCFRCLMATPEHPLECSHVLCDSCVREYGEDQDDLVTIISSCPLHRGKRRMNWEILRKPEFAGLRILCLDGGGIRGIVELEILRAIESCINLGRPSPGIPIQRLFDLVVGTSTGGIVALGLVAAQWSVAHCIRTFKTLCNDAFSERELADTVFEKLITLSHGSKWKTTSLHEALRKSLGEDLLFGGVSDSTKYATKVAVVSTSGTGNRSLIITNYNRQQNSDPGYTLESASRFDDGFRIWEAAAATSAAPSYFKPFSRNDKSFLDGAINHNNPVVVAKRERKLLWPDVESCHPDIFLSLGTGQDATAIDEELKRRSVQSNLSNAKKSSQTRQDDRRRYRALRGVKNFFSVLIDKIDNILDTEWTWQEFYRDTVGEHWATEYGSRYVRINPDLRKHPPPLDAKHEMDNLHRYVSKLLKGPTLAREINEVANALVASSFYFKKDESKMATDDHGSPVFVCRGHIRCKLANHDQAIKTFAQFLKNQILGDFVPSFVVKQRLTSSQEYKLELDKKFLDDVETRKVFEVRDFGEIEVHHREQPIYIILRLRQMNTRPTKVDTLDYPISGFPRRFMMEAEEQASRQQRRRQELTKRREANERSISMAQTMPAAPVAPSATRSWRSFVSRSTTTTSNTSNSAATEDPPDPDTDVDNETLYEQTMEEHKAWSADV